MRCATIALLALLLTGCGSGDSAELAGPTPTPPAVPEPTPELVSACIYDLDRTGGVRACLAFEATRDQYQRCAEALHLARHANRYCYHQYPMNPDVCRSPSWDATPCDVDACPAISIGTFDGDAPCPHG